MIPDTIVVSTPSFVLIVLVALILGVNLTLVYIRRKIANVADLHSQAEDEYHQAIRKRRQAERLRNRMARFDEDP